VEEEEKNFFECCLNGVYAFLVVVVCCRYITFYSVVVVQKDEQRREKEEEEGGGVFVRARRSVHLFDEKNERWEGEKSESKAAHRWCGVLVGALVTRKSEHKCRRWSCVFECVCVCVCV